MGKIYYNCATDSFGNSNAIKKSRREKAKKAKKIKSQILIMILLCCISFIFGRMTTKADAYGEDEDKKIENKVISNILSKPSIDKSQWNLLLVNAENALPDNFHVNLKQLNNGHYIDERAYPDLQNMMNDARAAGLSPLICSSYREMDKQVKLFNDEIKKYMSQGFSEDEAKEKAAVWVAVPGTSEHQLGLALDIVSEDYQLLDKSQEETPEQKWLMKNCSKYGFILRYPTDKGDITGIGYEPWHYRYVGKEAAKEIMEKGICLEEYLSNN